MSLVDASKKTGEIRKLNYAIYDLACSLRQVGLPIGETLIEITGEITELLEGINKDLHDESNDQFRVAQQSSVNLLKMAMAAPELAKKMENQ